MLKAYSSLILLLFISTSFLFFERLTPSAHAAWPMGSKSTNAKKFRKVKFSALRPTPATKSLADPMNGIARKNEETRSEAEKRRRYDLALRYGIDGARGRIPGYASSNRAQFGGERWAD